MSAIIKRSTEASILNGNLGGGTAGTINLRNYNFYFIYTKRQKYTPEWFL